MAVDPGVATIIAAAVIAIPGIIGAVFAGMSYGHTKVIKTQTNHMQEVLTAQANELGIAEGKRQEKNNPTA